MIVSVKFIAILFVVLNICVSALAQRASNNWMRPTTHKRQETQNASSTDSNNSKSEDILGQPLIPFIGPRYPPQVPNLFQLIFPALGMLLNWGTCPQSQGLLGSTMNSQLPQESNLIFMMAEKNDGKKARSKRQSKPFHDRTDTEGAMDGETFNGPLDSGNLPLLSQIFHRPLQGLAQSDSFVLGQSLEQQQTPIGQMLSQTWQDLQQRRQHLAQMLQSDLAQNLAQSPIKALGQSLQQAGADLSQRLAQNPPGQALTKSLREATDDLAQRLSRTVSGETLGQNFPQGRGGLVQFLRPTAIADRLAKRLAQKPGLRLGQSLSQLFSGTGGEMLGQSPLLDAPAHFPWSLAQRSPRGFFEQHAGADNDNEETMEHPFDFQTLFGGIKTKRDAAAVDLHDNRMTDSFRAGSSNESDHVQQFSDSDSMHAEASQISEVRVKPAESRMEENHETNDTNYEKRRNEKTPSEKMSELKHKADLQEMFTQKDMPILWFHRPSADFEKMHSRLVRQGAGEGALNHQDLETEAKLMAFERKLTQELQLLQEIEHQAKELRAAENLASSADDSPYKLNYPLSKTPVYQITRDDIEKTLKDDLFQKLLQARAQQILFTPYNVAMYGTTQRHLDSMPAVENLTREDLVKMMSYALRQYKLINKGMRTSSWPVEDKMTSTAQIRRTAVNEDANKTKESSKPNSLDESQLKNSQTMSIQQQQENFQQQPSLYQQIGQRFQKPHQPPIRELHPHPMIRQIPYHQWIDMNEMMKSHNLQNDMITRPIMMPQPQQAIKRQLSHVNEMNPFRKNDDTMMMAEGQELSEDPKLSSVSDIQKDKRSDQTEQAGQAHKEMECNDCIDPKKREMTHAATQPSQSVNHELDHNQKLQMTPHEALKISAQAGMNSGQWVDGIDKMKAMSFYNARPYDLMQAGQSMALIPPEQIQMIETDPRWNDFNRFENNVDLMVNMRGQIPIETPELMIRKEQQQPLSWETNELITKMNSADRPIGLNEISMQGPMLHQPMQAVERQMDELHHLRDKTDPMMMRVHEPQALLYRGTEEGSPMVGASPQMLQHAELIRKGNLYGILRHNTNDPSHSDLSVQLDPTHQERTGHRRFPQSDGYGFGPSIYFNGGHYGSLYGGGAAGTNAYGSGSGHQSVACMEGNEKGCLEEQMKLTHASQMSFQPDSTLGDQEKQFRSQHYYRGSTATAPATTTKPISSSLSVSTFMPQNGQPLARLGTNIFNSLNSLDFREAKYLSKMESKKNREVKNYVQERKNLENEDKHGRSKRHALTSSFVYDSGSLQPIDEKSLNELRKIYKSTLTEITLRPDEDPAEVLRRYNEESIREILQNVDQNPLRISSTDFPNNPNALTVNENDNDGGFYSVNEQEINPIAYEYNQNDYSPYETGTENYEYMPVVVNNEHHDQYQEFQEHVVADSVRQDGQHQYQNAQDQQNHFESYRPDNENQYHREYQQQDPQNQYLDYQNQFKDKQDYQRSYVVHQNQYQGFEEHAATNSARHDNQDQYQSPQDQKLRDHQNQFKDNQDYQENYEYMPEVVHQDQYQGFHEHVATNPAHHDYEDKYKISQDQQDLNNEYNHEYKNQYKQDQYRDYQKQFKDNQDYQENDEYMPKVVQQDQSQGTQANEATKFIHHDHEDQYDKGFQEHVSSNSARYDHRDKYQSFQDQKRWDNRKKFKVNRDYQENSEYMPKVEQDQYQGSQANEATKLIHHDHKNQYDHGYQDQHDHYAEVNYNVNDEDQQVHVYEKQSYVYADQYKNPEDYIRDYNKDHRANQYHDQFYKHQSQLQSKEDQGPYHDSGQFTNQGEYSEAQDGKNARDQGGSRPYITQSLSQENLKQYKNNQNEDHFQDKGLKEHTLPFTTNSIQTTNADDPKLKSADNTYEDRVEELKRTESKDHEKSSQYLNADLTDVSFSTLLAALKNKLSQYSAASKERLPILLNRLLEDKSIADSSCNDDSKEVDKSNESAEEKCIMSNENSCKDSNESTLCESDQKHTHQSDEGDIYHKRETTYHTNEHKIPWKNETEINFINKIHNNVAQWLKQVHNINQQLKDPQSADISKQEELDVEQIVDGGTDELQNTTETSVESSTWNNIEDEVSTKGKDNSHEEQERANKTMETPSSTSFLSEVSIASTADPINLATTETITDLLLTTQSENYDASTLKTSKGQMKLFRRQKLRNRRKISRFSIN